MDCLQIFVLKNQGFSDVYKGNGNELIAQICLNFNRNMKRISKSLAFLLNFFMTEAVILEKPVH